MCALLPLLSFWYHPRIAAQFFTLCVSDRRASPSRIRSLELHFIARLFSTLRFNNFMVCALVHYAPYHTRSHPSSYPAVHSARSLAHDSAVHAWHSTENGRAKKNFPSFSPFYSSSGSISGRFSDSRDPAGSLSARPRSTFMRSRLKRNALLECLRRGFHIKA